jgi:hypothetical protein
MTAKTVTTAKTATKKTAKKPARKPARKPMKMKAYASFDLYLADRPPKHQKIIRALRRFVKRTAPELQESVKWGNGCWLKGKAPVAYVYSAEDYVQFGFVRGSSLEDPQGLLEGEGQYVRHVKVRSVEDIDEKAFGALLGQARA